MPRDQFTDSPPYDVNEIYTGPASDNDGHSSNLRCAIPVSWAGAISDIVNSPDWPEIKSTQDFIRDAVHHRLKWADTQTERSRIRSVSNLMALSEASAAIARHNEYREAYEEFETRADDALRLALLTDDSEVTLSLIEDLSVSVPRFPEPYRTILSNKLDAWKRRA